MQNKLKKNKTAALCICAGILLAASAFASLFMGKFPLTLQGLLSGDARQIRVFWTLRFSRTLLAAAGGNPMLAAAMLPCICGAMHGVTPPYCACIYTGMGIAQSELKPTLMNAMFWLVPHYLLSVLIMLEWLPVWGLIG